MSTLPTRRQLLISGAKLVSAALAASLVKLHGQTPAKTRRVFDVRDYGAAGDATTLDTAAIQRAIDEAAAAGANAQVLLRGGKRYLVGALTLKGSIEFHLADDAELLASTDPLHFAGRAMLSALNVPGLRLTGTGAINGRSREFMTHFDEAEEWWRPKPFRPRLAILTGCKDLEVRDITFRDAASWTLHLMGCERVLVDRVKIRNQLDVPNCDGIDPDHCRDVEIKRCDIVCGDDAIVIKATRQGLEYGPSSKIRVSDCVLETQDSGVKIGTETVQDISDVRFERCEIKTGCRGLCIQLRDEGSVYDIDFRDIKFVSRYFSAPWWGRGEGISLTAIPRTPETKVGTIHDVRITNVTGRAENSARISGSRQSRIRNVVLENVDLTLDRWTKYEGGVWDNRPTSAMDALEKHGTPGFSVRHADGVSFRDCKLVWGKNRPDYFTHALEIENSTAVDPTGLKGEAAHPARDQAVVTR
ncbi:MAG TPA: glycosyl hydrolase family 28 protein [Opitutaceae bacterium]|nr:glycosyl hydrolase family 28 protein [Opitutaceae bacterium]